MMPIDARHGTKVIFNKPKNGWPHDQQTLKKHGLIEGEKYTVDRTEIHDCYTTLYLVEFPGIRFNTVNFSDV